MIKVKRVYDTPRKDDGFRILVDRLWPRGLSKQKAKIDLWLDDVAPSTTLRRWFAHDPTRWTEFRRRYFEELKAKGELLSLIRERTLRGNISLLYGAKENKFNNAVALKEYLERQGIS
jgi:uncharacterized protein YeaO (DUF488 family)